MLQPIQFAHASTRSQNQSSTTAAEHHDEHEQSTTENESVDLEVSAFKFNEKIV